MPRRLPLFSIRALVLFLLPGGLLLSSCASEEDPGPDQSEPPAVSQEEPRDAFWDRLLSLCGAAYEGRVVEEVPPDPEFAEETLVMHVRECGDDEILIPFHVGENRSRTWVLTRTETGLRLKHDHRHEDGSPEEVTMYGGDTETPGTAARQEFPADAHTSEMIPYAARNVWTLEVVPGEEFVYELRRGGSDRYFLAEFDLSSEVDPPPPPWGW